MNLSEFRNRLKQLKAYKAELERRLRKSPMRSEDNDFWQFGCDKAEFPDWNIDTFMDKYQKLKDYGKSDAAATLWEYFIKKYPSWAKCMTK